MRFLFLNLMFFYIAGQLSAARAETSRMCLSSAEARHVIVEQKLLDPLAVMKSAVGQTRAEPLRNRLCRWNQDMVYEISLLRRDGRVVHVNMRATDGKLLNPHDNR
jgi:uncharacterized membrane protein YkoI